jgi:hypothetical protein
MKSFVLLKPSLVKKSYFFRHNDLPFLYQEIFGYDDILETTKWKVLVSEKKLDGAKRDRVLLNAINYFKDNHPLFQIK